VIHISARPSGRGLKPKLKYFDIIFKTDKRALSFDESINFDLVENLTIKTKLCTGTNFLHLAICALITGTPRRQKQEQEPEPQK